ncbi:MAG: hypothetical protein WA324_09115 [Bryobacteraceae bacterium]
MERFSRLFILITLCTATMFADASYNEVTRFTGGTMVDMLRNLAASPIGRFAGHGMSNALQDQTSTVYIKGSKMARVGQTSTTIIDLDAGTITTIQNEHRTYSVMTFDQMQEAMSRGQRGRPVSDIKFDIKVEPTTNTKMIDGQTATETLSTLTATSPDANGATMVVHADYWMVPDESGSNEIREFTRKLATRYQGMAEGNPMMGAASKGISAAIAEGMKRGGYPVQIKTTISGVSSPMAGMTGRSGGNSGDPNAPFLIMESQYSNFASGPVDDSRFAIPEGYKNKTRER